MNDMEKVIVELEQRYGWGKTPLCVKPNFLGTIILLLIISTRQATELRARAQTK